jgi:hypothetical protein
MRFIHSWVLVELEPVKANKLLPVRFHNPEWIHAALDAVKTPSGGR